MIDKLCPVCGQKPKAQATKYTKEELKDADRKWVWVVRVGDYRESLAKYINGWGFALIKEGYVKVANAIFPLDSYDKTWAAYDKPPEN